jgi:hypothetical protein
VIAAATEDDYDSKDDDPGAVVVEKIAKAVVIHMFPPSAFLGQTQYHIMPW